MTTNDKVLVPREPTEDQARMAYWGTYPDGNSNQCNVWMTAFRWCRAMLAAAPQPAEDDDVPDEPTPMQIEYARGFSDGIKAEEHRASVERAMSKQPAEDGLPELPEAAVMTQLGRDAYTANQMLAFRAEGIAYAQQRSAGVVVDDVPNAWMSIDELPVSDDLFWFARGDTIDGPRAPQFGGYDADEWDWFAPAEAPKFNEEMNAERAALTAALSREEG